VSSFFASLFGGPLRSDLAQGRQRAERLTANAVPAEICQRLSRRLRDDGWHFAIGEVLFRRAERVESDVEWAGHSGYVDRFLVVYGWREHNGELRLHRLDHALDKGEIEIISDDALIRAMPESDDLRFVVAYRRGSKSHGLFALPATAR
jgi:hypothetical protein